MLRLSHYTCSLSGKTALSKPPSIRIETTSSINLQDGNNCHKTTNSTTEDFPYQPHVFSKMSKAKLKKHLQSLSKEQADNIILQLYSASNEAKAWLEFYIEPNSDAELEKYKKAIYRQCYDRNDWPKKPNFRECNKLVSAFKKLITDPHAIADLMLYYVEQTTSLPAQFGDFGEAYSISLENNYVKAIEYIAANGLMKEFTPRIKALIKDGDASGYDLGDVYWDYYNENKNK